MNAVDQATVAQIDVRGTRFAATFTTVVLAVAIILGPTWGGVLLAWQAIAFALGSLIGLNASPYGIIFRLLIRPRLAAPTETEPVAPPRFAQGVGLVFALVGLVGVALGLHWLFYLATGMALAAAFLNAAFSFCLGCEMYLMIAKLRHSSRG